jgi:hypothetical protein
MTLVVVCAAGRVQAQSFNFTGLVTAHIGISATNDVRDSSATPGVSMAVLDDHGLGVEVDVARLGNFDGTLFTESSVTSAMVNVIAMREHQTLRPFMVIGAGVIHVSGTLFEGPPSVDRTEVGWNAGGGLLFLINEVFGIRGDARYFRNFSQHRDLPLSGDGVLDFWRTSFGVTYAWPIR